MRNEVDAQDVIKVLTARIAQLELDKAVLQVQLEQTIADFTTDLSTIEVETAQSNARNI